jgi:hypothetical protein
MAQDHAAGFDFSEGIELTPTIRGRSSLAMRWLAVACLALVSLFAAAQVLHSHPTTLDDTSKDCPLCLVLQSCASVVHSVQIDFSLQTTYYLTVSADLDRKSVIRSFVLFSRPPPQA